jgi:predicted nucleic acid-binding protein
MANVSDAFLLDTNVASWACDAKRQYHKPVREWLASLADQLVFISVVTLAEVEYGLQISAGIPAVAREAIRAAMASYVALPIDRHTHFYYASMRAHLFRQYAPKNSQGRQRSKYIEDLIDDSTGKTLQIQENDLWIASVAVQNDLRLVTSDGAGHMRNILAAAEAVHGYANRAMMWPL